MLSFFKRKPAGPFTVEVEPAGEPGNWSFAVEPDQTILQAALAQGLPWPHRCRVGSCTTCRCRLLEGEVKQLTDTSYVLNAEQLQQRYILACQSQPKTAVRIGLDRVARKKTEQATSDEATTTAAE
jgi:ferredoxin